jgi:hypothetical protein
MTCEAARYIARRTPRNEADRRMVEIALRALAREERSVRAVELEIQRTLAAEERSIVEAEIAA